MPNTTNFNWVTPADTDLVKDGAAAIRTLGNGIDTSFLDLKGGTTGQILSKASNTDLDFTWTAGGDITEVQAGTGISVASGTGPIPVVTNTVATTFDAKGDLVGGTGADTFAKLTVGANDTVLTADSSTATGLKWAAPAASSGPAFKARRTADQNVASANTWTKVQLNAEVYDTDNCFDSTTNYRFTPTKAGYYQFNSRIYFPIANNNTNFLALYKNGAVVAQTNAGTNGTNANMGGPPGLSDLQSANGTSDYFEIYAFSTSAGNDIGGGAEQVTYLSGVWIRGL